MPRDKIVVVGAREHNLKNITVEIPRDQFVVITGLSGSGKSSLAFDTIFAEGQRRYVESLSAYARQFLGQMEKPDVDRIDGLSPAVSIDQKGVSRNPRSTVGTVTEIYDYLRLLFARIGVPHCPQCGREVRSQSAEEIVEAVLTGSGPAGAKLQILAPVIKERKGHHQPVFEDLRKSGYTRARVDGAVRDLADEIELERYQQHTIEAVVDRLVLPAEPDAEFRSRLTDSIETALKLGGGSLVINNLTSGEDRLFSENFACPFDGFSLPEIEPRTFSFNTPHGACPDCQGLGIKLEIDPELIIPNRDLSIEGGALAVMEWRSQDEGRSGYYWQTLEAAARHYAVPLNLPIKKLKKEQLDLLLYGSRGEKVPVRYTSRDGRQATWDTVYEGIIPNLKRRYE
ncbi:MAG: excinuclease ABC subunit UvrA, partial [Anaerolineales bacterium]|nr:excinuclease ABC subunit UvrA [Anaerolineales bacterium]